MTGRGSDSIAPEDPCRLTAGLLVEKDPMPTPDWRWLQTREQLTPETERKLVRDIVAHDPSAAAAFDRVFRPLVATVVGAFWSGRKHRDALDEHDDLVQEAIEFLLLGLRAPRRRQSDECAPPGSHRRESPTRRSPRSPLARWDSRRRSLKTYVGVCTRSLCRDQLRSGRDEQLVPVEHDVPLEEPGLSREQRLDLQRCLDACRLTPVEARLLYLVGDRGWTQRAAARELGVSDSWVSRHFDSLLERVRDAIKAGSPELYDLFFVNDGGHDHE